MRCVTVVLTIFALAGCSSEEKVVHAGEIAGEVVSDPTREGVLVSTGLPHGVQVFSDPITGCEYFVLYTYGITPRYQYSGVNSNGSNITGVKGCRP